MNKEQMVNELIEFEKENGNDMSGLYDFYYEPNYDSIRYESSGMAYQGDDSEAEYIGQTENGVPVNF